MICSKVFPADSMKPNKFKRHLEIVHSEYFNKPGQFLADLLKSDEKQKFISKKVLSVNKKVLPVSFEVIHQLAKSHTPFEKSLIYQHQLKLWKLCSLLYSIIAH